MESWVVGVNLGATKIALGLVDPQNHVVSRCRFPTEAAEGPQVAVERIAACVAGMEASLSAGASIAGVGACSPGPLSHETGMILDPPNLHGWRNVPFRQMLSEQLKLPVVLEHDAKAAALGEYHFGAALGARSMVYVVMGTGVGAAIVVNGEIYRGEHNLAGEVGHITIDPGGEVCACGNVGCVETFLSGPNLARAFRRLLVQTPELTPPGLPALPEITGELVDRMAQQGDPLALQVMARAGEALGTAVGSLAMILDIDLYVVGSSVAKAGDLLLGPARQALSQHAYRSVAARTRIVAGTLADDAPILGCGWLARQQLDARRTGRSLTWLRRPARDALPAAAARLRKVAHGF